MGQSGERVKQIGLLDTKEKGANFRTQRKRERKLEGKDKIRQKQ
jgi:hypothetical protein